MLVSSGIFYRCCNICFCLQHFSGHVKRPVFEKFTIQQFFLLSEILEWSLLSSKNDIKFYSTTWSFGFCLPDHWSSCGFILEEIQRVHQLKCRNQNNKNCRPNNQSKLMQLMKRLWCKLLNAPHLWPCVRQRYKLGNSIMSLKLLK